MAINHGGDRNNDANQGGGSRSNSGAGGGGRGGGGNWGAGGGGMNPGGSRYMSGGMFTGSREGAFNANRNLGLTTGKTWHGNTAFGPAGGRAVGYGMAAGGNGMGPSVSRYSNFRTPAGGAMFPSVNGMPVFGRNAGQAVSQMARLNSQMGPQRVGGLLDGEQVTSAPLPPLGVPAPASAPPFDLTKSMMPGLFGGTPPAQIPAPQYDYYAALRSAIPPGTMSFGPFNPAPTPINKIIGGYGSPGYNGDRALGYGGRLGTTATRSTGGGFGGGGGSGW